VTIWLKQGVLGDLRRDARRCKGRLVEFYEKQGLDFFITSLREGNHHPASCHYEGDAFDFKRQGQEKGEIQRVCGKDFDVVGYSDERDIFHVEFDPKLLD